MSCYIYTPHLIVLINIIINKKLILKKFLCKIKFLFFQKLKEIHECEYIIFYNSLASMNINKFANFYFVKKLSERHHDKS